MIPVVSTDHILTRDLSQVVWPDTLLTQLPLSTLCVASFLPSQRDSIDLLRHVGDSPQVNGPHPIHFLFNGYLLHTYDVRFIGVFRPSEVNRSGNLFSGPDSRTGTDGWGPPGGRGPPDSI